MVRSDSFESLRGRRRSPARILLVTLLVVAVLVLVWWGVVVRLLGVTFGSGFDAKRLDALEAEFRRDPSAFRDVDARMQGLVAEHPGAERITWTRNQVCVRDAAGKRTCEEASAADQEAFVALPSANVVLYQEQDERFTFVRFFQDDPPRLTVMHAPPGVDGAEYADEHGFREARDLGAGWTLLGPIPDAARERDQFPLDIGPGS